MAAISAAAVAVVYGSIDGASFSAIIGAAIGGVSGASGAAVIIRSGNGSTPVTVAKKETP